MQNLDIKNRRKKAPRLDMTAARRMAWMELSRDVRAPITLPEMNVVWE